MVYGHGTKAAIVIIMLHYHNHDTWAVRSKTTTLNERQQDFPQLCDQTKSDFTAVSVRLASKEVIWLLGIV